MFKINVSNECQSAFKIFKYVLAVSGCRGPGYEHNFIVTAMLVILVINHMCGSNQND